MKNRGFFGRKALRTQSFCRTNHLFRCLQQGTWTAPASQKWAKENVQISEALWLRSVSSHQGNVQASPPSIPAYNSTEGGSYHQGWVSSRSWSLQLAPHLALASKLSDTTARILDFGTIPRSPCTAISATVLGLSHGMPSSTSGLNRLKEFQNKEILNPKTLCVSQKLGAHKEASELPYQHAAIRHTCSLAGREPWRSMNLTSPVLHVCSDFHSKPNYPLWAA